MRSSPTEVRSSHYVAVPEEEALARLVTRIDDMIERTYMATYPGSVGNRISVEVSTACDPPLADAERFKIIMLLRHVFYEAGFDVDADYTRDMVTISWVCENVRLGRYR